MLIVNVVKFIITLCSYCTNCWSCIAKAEAHNWCLRSRHVWRKIRICRSNGADHREYRRTVPHRGAHVQHQPSRLYYVRALSFTNSYSAVTHSESLPSKYNFIDYPNRFRVEIMCIWNSVGPKCDCEPHDDELGHYTCDERTGKIICLPGVLNHKD